MTEVRLTLSRETQRLLLTLVFSSLLSIGLFIVRVISGDTYRYAFLTWNLALAWVPLGLAWWLFKRLLTQRWLTAPNVLLTVLWLAFLPNSFYILSDFVHLHVTYEVSVLYDAVMMTSFAFNGLVLGFMSLFLLHTQLVRRLPTTHSNFIVGVVLLLCSFAIYMGRYLRWNTWDILVDPAGVLFDLSDRFINPTAHGRTFSTTAAFFVLLGSMYLVIWHLVRAIRKR